MIVLILDTCGDFWDDSFGYGIHDLRSSNVPLDGFWITFLIIRIDSSILL